MRRDAQLNRVCISPDGFASLKSTKASRPGLKTRRVFINFALGVFDAVDVPVLAQVLHLFSRRLARLSGERFEACQFKTDEWVEVIGFVSCSQLKPPQKDPPQHEPLRRREARRRRQLRGSIRFLKNLSVKLKVWNCTNWPAGQCGVNLVSGSR